MDSDWLKHSPSKATEVIVSFRAKSEVRRLQPFDCGGTGFPSWYVISNLYKPQGNAMSFLALMNTNSMTLGVILECGIAGFLSLIENGCISFSMSQTRRPKFRRGNLLFLNQFKYLKALKNYPTN